MENGHNYFSGEENTSNVDQSPICFLSPRLLTRLGYVPPRGQSFPQGLNKDNL